MRDGETAAAWALVGRLDDIPVRGARVVNTGIGDVAVFRTARGRVFALRDRCPHKGGPLSQGIVHDEQVTCPLHGWVIGLADGAATGADSGCARTLPVRLDEGLVYLRLESAACADAAA